MKTILSRMPYLGQIVDDAQSTGLRAQGKIYVVIIVVAIVFLGIILYLASIDSRLRKLENKD
jgi:CcmD family protein